MTFYPPLPPLLVYTIVSGALCQCISPSCVLGHVFKLDYNLLLCFHDKYPSCVLINMTYIAARKFYEWALPGWIPFAASLHVVGPV